MYFGFLSEIILMVCLSYIQGLNLVFGTRDCMFIHFGICSIPFALLMIIWNESRKFMVFYLNNIILDKKCQANRHSTQLVGQMCCLLKYNNIKYLRIIENFIFYFMNIHYSYFEGEVFYYYYYYYDYYWIY